MSNFHIAQMIFVQLTGPKLSNWGPSSHWFILTGDGTWGDARTTRGRGRAISSWSVPRTETTDASLCFKVCTRTKSLGGVGSSSIQLYHYPHLHLPPCILITESGARFSCKFLLCLSLNSTNHIVRKPHAYLIVQGQSFYQYLFCPKTITLRDSILRDKIRGRHFYKEETNLRFLISHCIGTENLQWIVT